MHYWSGRFGIAGKTRTLDRAHRRAYIDHMTDSTENSYSELVVLAVKMLLQKTRQQKEFNLTFVGEDSILVAATEHFEQELVQILMKPQDYLNDPELVHTPKDYDSTAEDKWIQELAYEGRCMETIMRETGRSKSYIEKVLASVGFTFTKEEE